MNTLAIHPVGNQTRFEPGQTLAGQFAWNLPQPPAQLALRLLWSTSGKGTRDVRIVRELSLDNPAASGRRDFAFDLPAGPFSFTGSLITLTWALELVADDSQSTHIDLILAPGGQELSLAREKLDKIR
jgi:hypothetical protein